MLPLTTVEFGRREHLKYFTITPTCLQILTELIQQMGNYCRRTRYTVRHTTRVEYNQHQSGISSPPKVFLRKVVLILYNKFTGEHPCRSVISTKSLCIFIEITLRHGSSSVNLLSISRTPFPKNNFGKLPLEWIILGIATRFCFYYKNQFKQTS